MSRRWGVQSGQGMDTEGIVGEIFRFLPRSICLPFLFATISIQYAAERQFFLSFLL